MQSSFSFNIAVASSVTLTAQMYISTAYCTFENFLADSVYLKDMDECLTYITNIIGEKRKLDDKKYLHRDKTVTEVCDRLIRKFSDTDMADTRIMTRILNSVSQEDLNRIYYKNNLYEFIMDSKKMTNWLSRMMTNMKVFLDPMNVPDCAKDDLEKVKKALIEYVLYNHQIHNKQLRLQTEQRKVVKIIDTELIGAVV